MSSPVKREHSEDEDVDEAGPSVAKKQAKGYGYNLSAKLWVLTNYEYCDGDGGVSRSEVLSHFENEKGSIEGDGRPVILSHSSLGRIVHNLWKGKVLCRKMNKDGKKEAVLRNLHRKVRRPTQTDQHGYMMLINIPGWELRINNELSLSLIRVENWLLDDQRVVMEIRADPGGGGKEECDLSLRSHGCRVSPEDIGLYFSEVSDLNEKLKLIADFISTSHLCRGFEFCEAMTSSFLPNKVASYSPSANPDQQEFRAFSEKCQIISPPGSTCHKCTRLKLSSAKKKRRSEARSGNISVHHNDRYLTEEQLLAKLEVMKKAQHNARERELRLKRLIELGKDE